MNATTKHKLSRLPITKARINLGQVVRRVHVNKEHFILEKDGIPVAAIMDVEEFENFLKQRNETKAKKK